MADRLIRDMTLHLAGSYKMMDVYSVQVGWSENLCTSQSFR